jgi:hypothetical protein
MSSTQARWIRLGPVGGGELRAACAGIAQLQAPNAAASLLWMQLTTPVAGEPACIEEGHYAFALIAPLRLAPRRTRWRAWALAPALATYRQFGARAWISDESLWLNGRCIGHSGAQQVAGSVVIAGSFLPRLAGATPVWAERAVESVFRERISAQHGWEFENAWPSAAERAAIAEAMALAEADAG